MVVEKDTLEEETVEHRISQVINSANNTDTSNGNLVELDAKKNVVKVATNSLLANTNNLGKKEDVNKIKSKHNVNNHTIKFVAKGID